MLDPKLEFDDFDLPPRRRIVDANMLWGQAAWANSVAPDQDRWGYPWTRLGYTFDRSFAGRSARSG